LRSLQETETGIYGPRSFTDYLRSIDQNPREYRTAAELSIDDYGKLSNQLADDDTMVLRLGRAIDGPGTQFALVHVPGCLDDFFIDENAFNSDNPVTFDLSSIDDSNLSLHRDTQDMLEVYRSLPTFSETSLMNFALSIGLLSRALSLDGEQIGLAPTTVASTFSFEFEPHSGRPTVLEHNSGQVEIDGLIMTRRGGKRTLLVIEAKRGQKRKMAKHKLAYPALAADQSLSIDVDHIIPVYVRAQSTDTAIQYSIYECSELAVGKAKPCLAGLHVREDTHYEVRI